MLDDVSTFLEEFLKGSDAEKLYAAGYNFATQRKETVFEVAGFYRPKQEGFNIKRVILVKQKLWVHPDLCGRCYHNIFWSVDIN